MLYIYILIFIEGLWSFKGVEVLFLLDTRKERDLISESGWVSDLKSDQKWVCTCAIEMVF